MKHFSSMSPLHPKNQPLSNRPSPLPNKGGSMDPLCLVFKEATRLIGPSQVFLGHWAVPNRSNPLPHPAPPIEALSCFPLVPHNLHTWKLKRIWDKTELLLGTSWGTPLELDGNRKIKKIPSPPHPKTQKRKKLGRTGCILSLLIAGLNFLLWANTPSQEDGYLFCYK